MAEIRRFPTVHPGAPPRGLDAAERAEWYRVVTRLTRAGNLENVSRRALLRRVKDHVRDATMTARIADLDALHTDLSALGERLPAVDRDLVYKAELLALDAIVATVAEASRLRRRLTVFDARWWFHSKA